MSFFSEIKRRNVFKVGIAYAIVAWLLIQITATVAPALHLPDWTLTLVVYLTILGFPLALFLAWAYELTPEGIKTASPEGPAQYHTRTTGQRLNYFILGVVVLAVAFILVDNYVLRGKGGRTTIASLAGPATTAATGGTETTPGKAMPDTTVSTTGGPVRRAYLGLGQVRGIPPVGVKAVIALSRDGKQLVYVVNEGGAQLYHRQLNQLTAQVISSVTNPRNLCLSPDGEWAGFTSLNGGLAKVSLLGGTPQPLADTVAGLFGCFWAQDNVIYFIRNNELSRIPADGGESEAVNITSEYSQWNKFWPYGLPDGRHMLLSVSQGLADAAHTALLSLETGKTKLLIQNAYNARYVPTGHIVYMRAGSLWAVPFDLKQLRTTGPEVPVIDGVETHNNPGIAGYTFSGDGLLVYLPGGVLSGIMAGSAQYGLAWVDRKGNESMVDELQLTAGLAAPRLSPDGRQVAVGVPGLSGVDIWTYDFERGTFSRRTFSGNAVYAIWTPDGQRLIYGKINEFGIHWTRADGSGQPERLIESKTLYAPNSFTPDGSQLVIQSVNGTAIDLHTLSMAGEHTEQPLFATEFVETQAAVAPDGRWLAYVTNETGQAEVYVRPFPEVDNGKWQISTNGGMEPRWRRDGKELFYAVGQFNVGKVKGIAAVAIDTASGFHAGKPEVLFSGDYGLGLGRSYDVTADGQRFIMLKAITKPSTDIESQLTNLVTVENWFDELKRLAPPGK